MESKPSAHHLAAGARILGRAEMSTASVGGSTITREVMAPGWRWSRDLRPIVATDLCRAFHQLYVASGQLRVRMEDGTELDLRAGDAAVVPPGHDAWVVGDVPCEAIDFSRDYARLVEAGEALNALAEPGDGRPGVSRTEAARRLRAQARAGRLDGAAVELVLGSVGQRRRAPGGPSGLTQREIEVLVLIATGASAKQVGLVLGIQAKTARNHVERIYAKCGVSTRSDATRFAIAHGLVTPLTPSGGPPREDPRR